MSGNFHEEGGTPYAAPGGGRYSPAARDLAVICLGGEPGQDGPPLPAGSSCALNPVVALVWLLIVNRRRLSFLPGSMIRGTGQR